LIKIDSPRRISRIRPAKRPSGVFCAAAAEKVRKKSGLSPKKINLLPALPVRRPPPLFSQAQRLARPASIFRNCFDLTIT
jgi:hypothetical protein